MYNKGEPSDNSNELNMPINNNPQNDVKIILDKGRIAQIISCTSNELSFCFIDTSPHYLKISLFWQGSRT